MGTPSEELQEAIYAALVADAAIGAIVGDRISDGLPSDYPAITFGPSDYIPEDMYCIEGRSESLQIDCWVRDGGNLWPARRLADTVKTLLHDADLSLATHALTGILVERVRAFMDPDGLTGHGVVTVIAEIEER